MRIWQYHGHRNAVTNSVWFYATELDGGVSRLVASCWRQCRKEGKGWIPCGPGYKDIDCKEIIYREEEFARHR